MLTHGPVVCGHHRLQLLYNGEALLLEEGEEDEGAVARLSDVPAGGMASGLALLCIDEAGRPSKTGVAGEPLALCPSYAVSDCTGAHEQHIHPQA